MMAIKIKRSVRGQAGTFGLMSKDDIPFAITLEPITTIIPQGQYICTWFKSPKRKDLCYLLKDVPGHLGVEIHVGNTILDSTGCPLVGLGLGKINTKGGLRDGIINSKPALNMLRQVTGNADQFVLTIED